MDTTKPIDARVQDVVYNLDAGTGFRVIQGGLALALLAVVIILFQVSQFKGLKDAEAMEIAQLARNLGEQKSFVTQVVRPAVMEHLRINRPGAVIPMEKHPDLFHAPLYPVVLAGGFSVVPGAFVPSQRGVFSPEQWIMMPLNHLFAVLTGILVWMIGRRLFSRTIAWLALTCYFLSRTIWEDSISGLGLTMVYAFMAAAFYFTIVAAERFREGAARPRWVTPMLLAAVCVGLGALTRYAALAALPGLLLYLGITLGRRSMVWLPVFLAVILALLAPWMVRNVKECGAPFGLAPYLALNDSRLSEGDAWQRALQAPPSGFGNIMGALQGKMMERAGNYFRNGIPALGDGPVLWPLFVVTFFFRFVRRDVRLLRWGILLSLISMFLAACIFGDPVFRLMHMFWPFVIVYALAFFFVLVDRMQVHLRIINLAITALVVLLTATPYIFALLPPRAGVPYPPYFPPYVQLVSGMVGANELMCTDMPWATAWYGKRMSLYLPRTIEEFYQVNDYRRTIKGVYFTTITRDLPYARQLLSGPYKSWFPVMQGHIPEGFPLTQAMPLNNLDQLFFTDQMARLPEAQK